MKYLLITGANGDIGNDICKFFKEKHWNIIGTDLHDNKKNDFIDKYIGNIDLSIEKDIELLIEKLYDIKQINCLIHCAAYQCCKEIYNYTLEEWDKTYNVNVRALFLLTKNLIRIKKLNTETNIIAISSVHSLVTSKNIGAYASSKAALIGLVKNMSIDLSKFNIRVNAISPGAINTSMLRNHLNEEELQNLKEKHLLSKIGESKNISEACWFINENNFINGSNMVIDGGVSNCLYTE
jgi:NAD(P)-dependent dehydrogenase (short-subunit alcohol dehydrogenase family)